MACVQARIEPADEVLVGHYLLRKSAGRPLWAEGAVTERDLCGDEEPWDIFGGDGGSEKEKDTARYFFTNLKKKKYMNRKSSARAVGRGKGSWKRVGNGQPILNWVKAVIGWKRSFVYEDGNTTWHHGQWLMEEYSIGGVLLDHIKKVTHGKYDDYVLCRITSKGIMKQAERCINAVNSMDDDIVAAQFVRTHMAIEPNLEQALVNNVAAATTALVAQSDQISESCIVWGSPEGTMLGSSSTLAATRPLGEEAATTAQVTQPNQISESCNFWGSLEGTMLGSSSTLAATRPLGEEAATTAQVAQSNQISESCIFWGSLEGTTLGSSPTLAATKPPGEAAAAELAIREEESEAFTWISNEVEAQEQRSGKLPGTSTLINGSELMIVDGCNEEAWTFGIDDTIGLEDPGINNINGLEDPFDDRDFEWMLANCDFVI